MPNRQATILLKTNNIVNQIPSVGDMTLGEVAINTADAKLYSLFTGGITGSTTVRQIGWDKLPLTGGVLTGPLTGTTITATNFVGDGSGLTGISSGISSVAVIGSTPNASGATIAGSTLTLQPADASFGGIVTTGTQTFGGSKTFSGTLTSSVAFLHSNNTFNSPSATGSGTNSNLTGYTATNYRNAFSNSNAASTLPNASTTAFLSNVFSGVAHVAPTTGSYGLVSTIAIKGNLLTTGTGTITNNAALYIESAGSGATNNYALWVDNGLSKFDGDIIGNNSAATTNSLLPTQATHAGKYLTTNGTDTSWATVAGGSTPTPYAETPTGTVNGVNTTFTLANAPSSASGVIVILNGVVQYNGVDFTVSGSIITFIEAPATGSTIFVYYNTLSGGSSGSVTSVSIVTANGLSGTVATASSTPTITLSTTVTGLLKGNGTAISTAVAGTDYTSPSGTEILTNKRVNPRVATLANNSSDVTPDIGTTDIIVIAALTNGFTINLPIGSPVEGNRLMFRIKDNGTDRALTFNAIYRAIGVTLPTTTTANKTLYIGCIYNATDTKWDVIAVSKES